MKNLRTLFSAYIVLLFVGIVFFFISPFFFPDIENNLTGVRHGDFRFSFTSQDYIEKNIYPWYESAGDFNIDGFIRIFARSPLVFLFMVSQSNIITSYGFLILTYIIGCFSFDLFAKELLKINDKFVRIALIFLFIFNPIFTGYLAKLGLIFSIFLLPALIVFFKKFIEKWKIIDGLVIILLLNLSFAHPFTLIVNILGITLFGLVNYQKILKSIEWKKFLFLGLIAISLHLYILLPVTARVISQINNIESALEGNSPGDSLISLSKTEDLQETFFFYRSIFIDFNYYSEDTRLVYYFGVLLIYIIILALTISYIWLNYSKFKGQSIFSVIDRRSIFHLISLFALSGAIFILVQGDNNLLSFQINSFAINTPIGWIFRSPLKWQLYLPFLMATIIGLLSTLVVANLSKESTSRFLNFVSIGIFISVLFSNLFLFTEVFDKLIIPRSHEIIKESGYADSIKGKRVLFLLDQECAEQRRTFPGFSSEILYFLRTYARQVQTLSNPNYNSFRFILSDYDIAVSCQRLYSLTFDGYKESLLSKEPLLYSYAKEGTLEKISTPQEVLFAPSTRQTDNMYSIIENEGLMIQGLVSQEERISGKEINGIFGHELFSSISRESILNSEQIKESIEVKPSIYRLISRILPANAYAQFENNGSTTDFVIFIQDSLILNGQDVSQKNELVRLQNIQPDTPVRVSIDQGNFEINSFDPVFLTVVDYDSEFGILQNNIELQKFVVSDRILPQNKSVDLDYITNFESEYPLLYNNNNILNNPSFEEGSWQDEIGDCYNYDDFPDISKAIIEDGAIDGAKYINLEARRHIACIRQTVDVSTFRSLLLDFSVKGIVGERAQIRVVFNDNEATDQVTTFRFTSTDWEDKSILIQVPRNATKMSVVISSFEPLRAFRNIVGFDNFKLLPIPAIVNKYFIFSNDNNELTNTQNTSIEMLPSSSGYYNFNVKTNQDKVWIRFNNPYDVQWILEYVSGNFLEDSLVNANKFALEGDAIVWDVNINEICEKINCSVSEKGDKIIPFRIRYALSRPYNIGLSISMVTFFGLAGVAITSQLLKRDFGLF